jgi:hypothetical protein
MALWGDAATLTGTTLDVWIGITLVVAGGAALMTGRAIAITWRPPWQVVFACFGLGFGDRFLIYGLFDGPLLSLPGFLFDTAVLIAMGLVAFRVAKVRLMVRQYPWLYRKTGPFTYRPL